MISYQSGAAQGTLTLPVTMRANPSISFTGTFKLEDGGAAYTTSNTSFDGTANSIHSINFWISGFSGLTDGYPYYAYTQSGGTLKIDAEL